MCPCGLPLHYTNPVIKRYVEDLIATKGEKIMVTTGSPPRSWMVPRHYIALHGLKAAELPNLGFEEVEHRTDPL